MTKKLITDTPTRPSKGRRGGKRGNGEGTIRLRKKGGYEARLTLGSGARKSIYEHSYEEVRRRLVAAIRDRDDGALMLGDARQTVGKYLMSWLQITKATVEASTYESYEGHVRRHIIPSFWAGATDGSDAPARAASHGNDAGEWAGAQHGAQCAGDIASGAQ
jgi:hypothetical protein